MPTLSTLCITRKLDCLAPPHTQKRPYIAAAPHRHQIAKNIACSFVMMIMYTRARTQTRTSICVTCAVHFIHIVCYCYWTISCANQIWMKHRHMFPSSLSSVEWINNNISICSRLVRIEMSESDRQDGGDYIDCTQKLTLNIALTVLGHCNRVIVLT